MEILSKNLLEVFNKQVGNELHNSNQYLAIEAYFKDKALFNIAGEFHDQMTGEREHAEKFINFIVDSRAKLVIPAITVPINDFASAVDAARSALALEIKTTQEIYNMVDIAQKEKNHIVYEFLQWFVSEQQEEMATATDRLNVIFRNKDNLELADITFEEKK